MYKKNWAGVEWNVTIKLPSWSAQASDEPFRLSFVLFFNESGEQEKRATFFRSVLETDCLRSFLHMYVQV